MIIWISINYQLNHLISKITIIMCLMIRRCWVQKFTYRSKYNTCNSNSWIKKTILKKKQSKTVQGMSEAYTGKYSDLQGRTGGNQGLHWQTGDVYRGEQGVTGYIEALYIGTQRMYMGWQWKHWGDRRRHDIFIRTGVLRASSVGCFFSNEQLSINLGEVKKLLTCSYSKVPLNTFTENGN